ncbi:MAG: N-acetylmuramoyl-L-alanine amidase [Maribacter sp.]|nr:N-acetylmuramoyl-L-alanine amidase [Maribacter sp.]
MKGKNKIFILLILAVSLATAQNSSISVKAEKGDGIYSLLRKQGLEPSKSFDDFVALNRDNLGDGVHLYQGRSYLLPGSDSLAAIRQAKNGELKLTKGTLYPIFGKKHAEITAKSSRLKETVYYLISGHGGPDPGAITQYNGRIISEDEYAYDITLRLARELISHGALVYVIIRDEDDGIRDGKILKMDKDEIAYSDKAIPLVQLARLKQRVDIVNELYKTHKGQHQRLIVTHVDSRSKSQNIDVFFYHHEKSKSGKKLAESIHATFKKKYKKYQPNREYSGTLGNRNLYLVKQTLPAMAYIEIGNIRNKKDQLRILDPDNRQALAKWISEGVLLDYQGK